MMKSIDGNDRDQWSINISGATAMKASGEERLGEGRGIHFWRSVFFLDFVVWTSNRRVCGSNVGIDSMSNSVFCRSLSFLYESSLIQPNPIESFRFSILRTAGFMRPATSSHKIIPAIIPERDVWVIITAVCYCKRMHTHILSPGEYNTLGIVRLI
jgi:hypothetical protein